MISELKVYDAIKPKLGEEEAKMLLELIETKVDSEATRELVTKAHLTAELAKFKSEVKTELSEFKSEFANLKTEITSGIIWKVLAISGGQLAILLAILKLFAT